MLVLVLVVDRFRNTPNTVLTTTGKYRPRTGRSNHPTSLGKYQSRSKEPFSRDHWSEGYSRRMARRRFSIVETCLSRGHGEVRGMKNWISKDDRLGPSMYDGLNGRTWSVKGQEGYSGQL